MNKRTFTAVIESVKEEHIPSLVSMGRDAAAYNSSYPTEYSPERAEASLRGLMQTGIALVCHVDGVLAGFILGSTIPIWYGDTAIAVAIALWVDPAYRGLGVTKGLVTAFEFWGLSRGATAVNICDVCIDGKYPSDGAFKAMGYKPVERGHVKEVSSWQQH